MTNVVVHLYSYGGSHRVEDSIRTAAQNLAPQIMNVDGMFSYTLFKIDDGRFGSATLCSNDRAAHGSTKAAVGCVSIASVMQHVKLDLVIQGRSFFTYEGSGDSAAGMYGHLRIIRSQGSVDEWRGMAEQELKPLGATTRRGRGLACIWHANLDNNGNWLPQSEAEALRLVAPHGR
jgi:hypothetical protein